MEFPVGIDAPELLAPANRTGPHAPRVRPAAIRAARSSGDTSAKSYRRHAPAVDELWPRRVAGPITRGASVTSRPTRTERLRSLGVDAREIDVRTLSYQERRLLIVDDARRKAVLAGKDANSEMPVQGIAIPPIAVVGGGAANAAAGAAAGAIAAVVTQQLIDGAARRRARRRANGALPVLVIGQKEAANLSFPLGHPLKGTVYVGHPGIAGAYLPMATFHRVLFNEKAAEALRLLRSLAANEINIEYIEGFKTAGGVDFSMTVPQSVPSSGTAKVTGTKESSTTARVTMHFDPDHEPAIATDLMWYHQEPLWREVAEGRMVSGLRDFQIEVHYFDDFDVDAKLEARIAEAGLSTGGHFTEFRSTIWKLSGTFKAR